MNLKAESGNFGVALAVGKNEIAKTGKFGVAVARDEAKAETEDHGIAIAIGQKTSAHAPQGGVAIAGKGGTADASGYGGISINNVSGPGEAPGELPRKSIAQAGDGCVAIVQPGGMATVNKNSVAIAMGKKALEDDPENELLSTVHAKDGSVIVIGYKKDGKRKYRVGLIGDAEGEIVAGLDGDTTYCLDENNNFKPVG